MTQPVPQPPALPFDWQACIQDARAGSAQALGRLLEACRPQLIGVAQRELDADLQAKAAPSDLVQETCLDAHRDFSRFIGETEDEVRAWLCRVLIHNVGDLRQRFHAAGKRQVSREASLDQMKQGADRKDALADETPSPSSNAGRREEEALVEAALAKLPEQYQQVIRLRHQEHLSFAAIGRAMDRSEDAVQKLWERAIKQLRETLARRTP